MNMLELKAVKKCFPQGGAQIPVLNGIDFSMAGGEKVAILGRSGSGKSTLLNVVAGLLAPDEGEIFYHGKKFSSMSEEEIVQYRANELGIVYQDFLLLDHLNAFENVRFALEVQESKKVDEERVKYWLNQVGLGHRWNHRPAELSGGEQQRVAIARAMAGNPHLVLADEPNGNLDMDTGREVMNLFFAALQQADIGLILVTHDQELAKNCDRVVSVVNGVIH